MAKYERGSTDPDDVRVFDGGEDDEEDGGAHLPVVIVISLLVLAAFGGVVWLAYNNGVARGRADVPAPVMAENTASEQQAVAPGSGASPPKQIKVYQQQAGSDEDSDQQVATAPPAQLTKPAAPPAAHVQPAEAKPVPAVQKSPPAPEAKAPAPKPAAVAPATSPPAAPPAKPVVTAAAKPAAETPVTPPVATPAKTAATVPPTAGAYVLQIGAYKSQSDANAAWKAYRAKHAALLSGLGPNVQKADLGDKGVWYRLRVGSFADKDAAGALCDRLKSEGGVCFPAK
jgi:cell division protein FtsN